MKGKMVSAIMLTLLLTGILTLAFNIQPVKSEPETIIVPDDYPTIQEAINNANEGDTVFVRNGTYYEHLNVSKTIELLGENRNATIIDGNSTGTVVLLRRSNITIQNFTIRNSGPAGVDSGIWAYYSVNNSKIIGNLVTNCCWAIRAENGAFNSTICGNIAERSHCGALLLVASNCRISSNILNRNDFCGVWLINAAESNVSDNYISENGYLLSGYGIYIERGSPINITNFVDHNSFIDNRQQAYCKPDPPEWEGALKVIWDDGYPSGGNYWSDYAGIDLHSGPNQNEAGSDGMGDTPYVINENNTDRYPLMNPWPSGWKLDFTAPTNHPIVDFAVYNGSLYAAADNKLYMKNGSSWDIIDAPAFVTSLEPYGGKLVVGGQGGLYCYDGTSFGLIFSVPTYIKVLGVYDNRLYAGTMLDNPPKLYYCNGSPDNPSDWHVDTDFSTMLNFSGPFGSIDSFGVWSNEATAAENPVGYWKFDEGTGTVAYDSSICRNNGTLNNGPLWVDGRFGKALSFDGKDDYVEVPNSPELNPASISVEAWVNFRGSQGLYNSMIISKGTDDRANGWYSLFWTSWDGRENLCFQLTELDNWWLVRGTTEIVEGIWYHVAGTYNGSVMRLYVNGLLEGELAANVARTSNTGNLQIGAERMWGFEYWVNGTIDDVKVCDHALTPQEIWNDYARGESKMYLASGSTVYSCNGTEWNLAKIFTDVHSVLDMQVYNGKLYLATRDQGWRKPFYQGGTGFSGRVIEYDGENWTTVLDHDYWVYSLEEYDGKLYAGTANKVLTYNGTDWETSFNATEGAYYAISMITFDGKIYAGMGNGYIFADPAPLRAEQETITVPEFSSTTILAVFMALTMLAAALTRKKRIKRFC